MRLVCDRPLKRLPGRASLCGKMILRFMWPFRANDLAADHARMTTWFCDSYASWQKAGVEKANGRLRRWLPLQIDISQVSDAEIQYIVLTANHPGKMPRLQNAFPGTP
jgi:hypothetical protein